MSQYDKIIKIQEEILDVLNRTYWVVELPKHPTKLQMFLSRYIFKQEFKKIIKEPT